MPLPESVRESLRLRVNSNAQAGSDPALDVTCRFEFVTEDQFNGNPPGEEFAGAGQAPCIENPVTSSAPGSPAVSAEVHAELGGLVPSTKYHLRLVAENGGGADAKEADATFTTEAIVHPTLTIDSITDIGYMGFHVTRGGRSWQSRRLPLVRILRCWRRRMAGRLCRHHRTRHGRVRGCAGLQHVPLLLWRHLFSTAQAGHYLRSTAKRTGYRKSQDSTPRPNRSLNSRPKEPLLR